MRMIRFVSVLTAAVLLAGCAAVTGAAGKRFASSLSAAVLDQEDPELVREALPAYLLLLDALIKSDPENPATLSAAAQLYAAYGVVFVADDERAETLTARARELGAAAVCAADDAACGLADADFERFAAIVDGLGQNDADALYSYCVGTLAYIRTHSEDWAAVAMLPQVGHALQRLLLLPEQQNAASINMYLGILNTLRPPALGGQPEEGKRYFETALSLSEGRDLSAKVEYARSYARLMYDRELHDRLLNEVLQAPTREDGLTLFNTLAKRQAKELLASADDYF